MNYMGYNNIVKANILSIIIKETEVVMDGFIP